jgi:putative endonuclease
MYFVYILRCNDNSLYTGITTNLCRRFYEHNFTNKSAKYTKTKRPVKLEYYEVRKTRSEATKRENAIKRLSKEKKENLIYKEK